MKRTQHVFVLGILCLVMLIVPLYSASAQGGTINPGENQLGQITAEAPFSLYTFNGVPGQRVDVQVVSLQAGLIPQFSILNPAQVTILAVDNAAGQSIAVGSVELSEPGQYSILVNSLNAVAGQFVVTLGGEIPAPPPPPSVSQGNPASGALNPGEQATFDIVGNPDAATIVDLGDVTATAGLTIELRDPADNLVGVMSGGLIGGTLIIPPTDGTYKITLINNTSAPIPTISRFRCSPLTKVSRPKKKACLWMMVMAQPSPNCPQTALVCWRRAIMLA